MERYNFKEIEEKWQKLWENKKTFSTKVDQNKKKFYCLEMFPYPSGKIHMVIMYFIQWDGTLLECQQKMLQEKII